MSKEQANACRLALKAALSYAIVAGCWILFSDELLKWFVGDPDERTRLSIIKGWSFVLVTGVLLYSTLRHRLRQLAQETEKLREAEIARQEAWKKQRQSEEQLRYLSDNLPNTMLYQVRVERDGRRRFCYLCEGVGVLHGCSVEEAMADAARIYGNVFEEDRHRLQLEEELAIKSQSIFRTELRFKTPSGGFRWSQIISSPRKLEDGAVVWDGIEMDVAERKRAEEKLLASEQFKEAILDSVVSHIAVLDCRGVIVAVNAQWRRFAAENSPRDREPGQNAGVGVSYLEVCRASFGESAEGAMAAHEGILAVIEGRMASFSMEYPCHSPQAQRWFSMSVTPLGKENAVVVSHTNISERKFSEQALRVREEQLRLYAEQSPLAVAMFDRDMRYLVASRRWMEDFRLGNQPLAGRSHYEVFPEIPPRWIEIHKRCLAGAIEKCDEDEFPRADGRTDWIRWEIRPWHLADDSIGGVIIFSEDISKRKEAERRLLQINRLYALLSDINQDIVREKDPNAMLASACQIAVEKGKFRIAWVGLFNAATGQLEAEASAGSLDGYLDLVRIDLRNKLGHHGLAARCFDSGEHAICNDVEHDPQYPAWPGEGLRRRGYCSVGAFPLKVDGKTVGVVMLYADAPEFFDEEQVRLLDELAVDIGFALEVSRQEKQRQLMEEELNESQRRYKSIFDGAPDGVLLMAAEGNETGRILAANEIAARMHGYEPEELLGKSIQELDAPDAAAKAPERLRRIAAGEQFTFEINHRRKDGTIFPVEVKARQIMVDGRVCMLGFDRDISERKRVEATQARLATAVEQAAETVVITDASGTIIYVNPAFEKSSGYTQAEVIGQNPRLLKSGKQSEEFYRQMWEVLERGEAWQGHFLNCRKDGTTYEEDATISPVRDLAGKIISYVAVKRDVTREVQLERQFLQAQKMESVGQLAGGVAHDFNNMLAAMMMHLGILQGDHTLGPEAKETIKELLEDAQRAANITRQLLMFSRRSVMEVKLLDLNEVVMNLLKMLGRLIGEHIVVRFDRQEGLPPLEGDAGMVEQVILNLAVNARDAMPKGGQLSIGLEAIQIDSEQVKDKLDVRPGRFLLLSVADNGCGMDEATRLRIFEPFFTTKEPGKGTGLGLATVHGIVAQHKGWVEVESALGKGTTCRVFLPASAKRIATAPQAAKTEAMRGHETILVVEDEVALRRLVSRSLRLMGYAVFEAENGQSAMKLWQERGGNFDLLFSDMVMPEGLTGLDLAEKFKLQRPDLKVIISSGYSAETAGPFRLAAQGVVYLQKPYRVESLSKAVRDCLDAGRG